jgi:hypothetical protein
VGRGAGVGNLATLRPCPRLRSAAICLTPIDDAARLAGAVALVHERRDAPRVAAARRGLPSLRVVLSVDDDSGADLTGAGSEDFESALAGANPVESIRPL